MSNSSQNFPAVNVSKSRLGVGYDKQAQQAVVTAWQTNNTFSKVNELLKLEGGQSFTLLDGPPYANGDAHMGHALNKLYKDLVVKSQWFCGRPVEYQPGWDCHGLPLELAVEKKYGKLDTDTLKTRCKQLAFRSLVKQRKTFKNLGVLGQWDNPYVTLSEFMVKSSWNTLQELLKKDLLEYKQYPVHHCPACGSSLAEAELETKLLPKDSLHFLVNVNGAYFENMSVVVWTTTPWTLPMNQAVAYHRDFEYRVYKQGNQFVVSQLDAEGSPVSDYLVNNGFEFECVMTGAALFENKEGNATGVSPLTGNSVPVVHADFVEEGKTGFVHLAFAHGPEDYQKGVELGLKPVSYLTKNGVFDTNDQPSGVLKSLHGKKYTQVQPVVCQHLSETNTLVAYSQNNVEQQVCWRHKCGVYYNATHQVFLKLEDKAFNLKQAVQKQLQDSSLTTHQVTRLKQMLLGREHWCLSRQRKWGCPMNLLVSKSTGLLDVELSKQYLQLCMDGVESFKKQFLEKVSHTHNLFDDVLDVWFDSGNVANHHHQQVAEKSHTSSQATVDLVLEGKDQFRGWFQSLLWLTVAVQGKLPYKNLYCHGFVLADDRTKLSKSAGNSKNTVEHYLTEYGVDVLRLWVSSQESEQDAVLSEKKLEEVKRYYSRFRLCLRFLSSNLYDYDSSCHQENLACFESDTMGVHRYMLAEMTKLRDVLMGHYSKYEFKQALEELYSFCDKTMSSFYFDWVKNPMYLLNAKNNTRKMHQTGMFEVMLALFELVKVFMPVTAQEFYQDYFGLNENVFTNQYFAKEKLSMVRSFDEDASQHWEWVQSLRKKVQASLEPLQKNKELKARTEAGVRLKVNNKYFELLNKLQDVYRLPELFGVSQVWFESLGDNEACDPEVYPEVLSQQSYYCKCPRCWSYQRADLFKDLVCFDCSEQA